VNKSIILISLIAIFFNVSCKKDPIASANTVPTASFTVNPTTGTTATTFTFDASSSTDNEDATTALQVRWDWTNDGTYDTDFSTTKIATHQYADVENYTIELEVKDTGGLTHTTTKQVIVSNCCEFTGTVTDVDGNVYQTIQIGNQEWMAENLKVTRYRNGEAIPHITDGAEWGDLYTGAYCSYDNNDSNIVIYGLLYNWFTVSDIRNLAPTGWHVPTDMEWKQLEMYLGMSQEDANGSGWRGTDEGGKLKETGTMYWKTPNEGATNSSCFSARPGGHRSTGDGTSYYICRIAHFWTSTSFGTNSAYRRALWFDSAGVGRDYNYTQDGNSVRCVRD